MNISKKLHWKHHFQRLEETETHPLHLFTIQYPHTWRTTSTIQTNVGHYHFFNRIPILYLATFWSIQLTKPMFWLRNSGIGLIVVLEYSFFQLCSNTELGSLRFTRFRRSYVNRTAHTDALPITVKVKLLFCLMCAVQSGHVPFFNCLSPMIVHLRNLFLLSKPPAQMVLTPRWVSRRKHTQ